MVGGHEGPGVVTAGLRDGEDGGPGECGGRDQRCDEPEARGPAHRSACADALCPGHPLPFRPVHALNTGYRPRPCAAGVRFDRPTDETRAAPTGRANGPSPTALPDPPVAGADRSPTSPARRELPPGPCAAGRHGGHHHGRAPDPGDPRGRRGGPGRARGGGPADAGRAVPGAGGVRGRAGAAQVREPAAHRHLQDPRRLPAHPAARRRRARPRRRRGQRRQPRPGRRAGGRAARHPRDGVHARGRAAAQGGGHPRLRRRRPSWSTPST